MNTTLLPPSPSSTASAHQRRTDLREVLFPVAMRPLHFLDDDHQPVAIGSHRAVIHAGTGEHLGVVGSGYRLVTNEEALKFARQCAAELFGAAHANLEIFNIYTPSRPNLCRIDLIHKGYEVNVFRQEIYLPFLRLSNSYNARTALRFDIGYCRKLCLNGVIFESEVIEFRFPHSRERIPETLSFKLGKERMEAVRKSFGAWAERLQSHRVDECTAVPLFFKALNLPLPKSTEDYERRAEEFFEPLKSEAETLVQKYADEMGANAYALFNAVTDFASRPPALRDLRRSGHSMQMQAGRWLREFDELLQANPKPDLANYLGEYSGAGHWN
ncbi:MAG: DUF932 domain-containing protein [Chthoniobacteraceae bacterium]